MSSADDDQERGSREPPETKADDHPHHSHSPVEEAREIVDYTVDRVRDVGTLIGSIRSRSMLAALVLYVAAAATGTAVVYISPVRDWYMFLAMYIVVLAFILLYLKAHVRRRPVVKTITLTFTLSLLTFYCYILWDRIPARRVWYGGEVIHRPELPLLWLPIGGLSGVALLLIVHYAVVRRPPAG